jgi:hypothetical protein
VDSGDYETYDDMDAYDEPVGTEPAPLENYTGSSNDTDSYEGVEYIEDDYELYNSEESK